MTEHPAAPTTEDGPTWRALEHAMKRYLDAEPGNRDWMPVQEALWERDRFHAAEARSTPAEALEAEMIAIRNEAQARISQRLGGDFERGQRDVAELVLARLTTTAEVERLADATKIAAMALHRWKHPSFDLGEYRCRCRDDAEMAVRLLSPHNREADHE